MNTNEQQRTVAVLGAGPVGLAAAAHLIGRGLTPLVFEAGPVPGANLASYRHVRLFSPWQYDVDKAARQLLERHGWTAPAADALPTAGELIDDYLAPLAATPEIAPHLLLGHRVTAITRAGFDKVRTKGRDGAPFLIRADTAEGPRQYLAGAVIDATGTWSHPNPLGADGIPALGEAALAARIDYGMPDVLGSARARFAGKRILVVGAGHSAAGTLIALARLAQDDPGTRIVWATRGARLDRVFGGGDADGLPARGQLGMRLKALRDAGGLELRQGFRIHALSEIDGRLRVTGAPVAGTVPVIDGIDRIVCAAGARPDLSLTRELRVRHDPWLESTDALAPLIDPNEHSCGTVRPHGHRELAHPEPGYYVVGAKSYGRAPNFLLATGYEQVRSVVAALAGDLAAADDVQLDLPETGVCNTRLTYDDAASGTADGCCGVAPAVAAACCVPAPGAGGTCGCRTPAAAGCCA
ncbi:NAD(P)-binding domain-containing protein [Telluria mixta]|uniref:NAD(P)-binding domain-containing protein n=1 Tax=Telluria mixta TaxID=34071 RepID=A0ABT2BU31_9BURK|nr:NAD(P)-binding protein [Telluria mixta]MCS0628631.1 NAD(P)-binding domain-containing protein [Telluria mixta]WEM93269.1 NAD(P)-binding domain-containing protein [Telluria mixta]